jgi:phospholipid/cholesterol/gamma-HCH transport system ATP-binding protein
MIVSNDSAIDLSGVSCELDGRCVLNNVSFSVLPGQALCLLGRSGMGKSVTLKLIVGLLKPVAGRICMGNEDIVQMDEDQLSKVRCRVGFLFQDGALFDSMSLYENLAFPLQRLHKAKSNSEIDAIVKRNLADVGLAKHGHKMPNELSGGMRKRAGLARALLREPRILLVDEPTSGLDRMTATEIDELLLRVRMRDNPTMVIVTHDIREARRIGDVVAVLDNCSLIGMGHIDELANSDNALVRALVSEAN